MPSSPSSSSSSASIRVNEPVRIVRKGTSDYERILRECRAPLEEGTELVFRMKEQQDLRAASSDTQAYIDLLVCAGSEAARIDAKRYRRTLPDLTMQELGIRADNNASKSMPAAATMAMAKSSDGGGGISLAEVAKHTTNTDCWVVVNGQVLNVTNFLKEHPGGELAILTFAGKDASEEFNMIHPPDVIGKYAPDAVIGRLKTGAVAVAPPNPPTAGGAVAKKKEAPRGPWYEGEVGMRRATFLGSLITLTAGACLVSHFPMGISTMLIGLWWARDS